MVKFAEAEARKFRSVFVCKRCKTKIKAQSVKIAQGRISCRKCGKSAFRAVRRK